ncbi:uncharacterized protein ACB057_008282 [Neosynchiropus ocellatus]
MTKVPGESHDPASDESGRSTAAVEDPEPYLYLMMSLDFCGRREAGLLLNAEKPMPQGPPGGVIGILGGVVAIGLIVGVAVTVVMVHKRQQKPRTETDNDLTDLPPAHKPAPPPPKKKNSDMKGHLTSDDIQVVHIDKDEELQKLPLQPPYYDMAPSESTPFTDKPNSGHKDCDVQYAELDTAALASSPSPRSSTLTGPGDLVEYATIQPSSH